MPRRCLCPEALIRRLLKSTPRGRIKACVILFAVYMMVFEVATYVVLPAFVWPRIDKHDDQLRLLLVADPRLRNPGDAEVARWDTERFMRRTFKDALEHARPHMVVFLGDNWRSVDVEKTSSLHQQQFSHVFGAARDVSKVLVLPGELDVGDDPDSPTTLNNTIAFAKTYGCPHVVRLGKKYDFFVVDSLSRGHADPSHEDLNSMLNTGQPGTVRVLLSHLPILPLLDRRLNALLDTVKPHVIFSAHERTPHLVRATKTSPAGNLSVTKNFATGSSRFTLKEETNLLEFLVPSSAYDVTPTPGFGLAIFSESMLLDYATLWTPSRTPHLVGYVTLTGFCVFLYIVPRL
ncbi:uncharacterized protein LOC135384236 [Ornithodoros turicata]|uniref:uncharacterized protein LOC135384236 n=1 Tax=Ornithodoros turicata TaxID=34597 RepID=UPI003138D488